MRAYSLDLREKIVESVKKGVPKSETARRFGVYRATVKRYSAINSTSAALWSRGGLQAESPEAGREGKEAALRRPRRAPVGHPLPERS